MSSHILLTLSLLCIAGFTQATLGIDIHMYYKEVSKETFQCLKNAGYDFVSIQAFNGAWGYNPYTVQTAENAYAAGMNEVSFNIFVGPKCSNQPIDSVANGLKGYSKPFRFWIDIQGWWGCWYFKTDETDKNLNYLQELVNSATSKFSNSQVGIKTYESEWLEVVGNTTNFKSLPLWYGDHDGKQAFKPIKFGGWSQPYLKEYRRYDLCGMEVGHHFHP